MYDSILSGSICPLFASTMASCLRKKGCSGSARATLVAAPSVEATSDGAPSGVTFSYRTPLGSTATRGPWQHSRMHPTPRTSTRSPSPASFTALSRPALTASAREDMQPAAVQQRMTVFLREAFSFSAIAMRSSMSMGNPSFHVGHGRLGRLAGNGHPVVDDGGRYAAGANAAGGQERELLVGSRLAGLDARLLLDRGENLGRAADVACGAEADDARVGALRLQGEEMVERGDAVDAAGRKLQLVGDEQEKVVLEEAEELLRLVEDLDQGVLAALELLDVRLKDLEALVPARMLHDAD